MLKLLTVTKVYEHICLKINIFFKVCYKNKVLLENSGSYTQLDIKIRWYKYFTTPIKGLHD